MNPSATVLRILDANLNRAREALRVIEDYARFALNDKVLCGQLKQLRHDLAEATSGIVSDAILHRDTPGDVGTANKTSTERSREDVGHVVVASGKRLGEALRTIEEYLKTTDGAAASKVEAIRYRFYDLERVLSQTIAKPQTAMGKVQLYVLITEKLCKLP